ncbi:Uncharacterised protein r2_g2395 [Pycnogonum litorale]
MVNPHLYAEDEKMSKLIAEEWNWDGDTKTRAQGILANLDNFEIIVSLVVLKNVLCPLREITKKLQKRDLLKGFQRKSVYVKSFGISPSVTICCLGRTLPPDTFSKRFHIGLQLCQISKN